VMANTTPMPAAEFAVRGNTSQINPSAPNEHTRETIWLTCSIIEIPAVSALNKSVNDKSK